MIKGGRWLLLPSWVGISFLAGCGGESPGQDPDPCRDVSCSDHGYCVLKGDGVGCVCEGGYHAAGLECVASADPCNGITCSGHGSCEVSGGSAACSCDQGYHPSGTTCLVDSGPCDGVACSDHGACQVSAGNAVCDCDDGYHPAGLECLVDDPTDVYAEARQLCVDLTNDYRAGRGVAALTRATAHEACTDQESERDSRAGIPHNSLGSCGELAQNQCEGFGYSAVELVRQCLQDMFDEGPGYGLAHAHYEQMMNPSFDQVACGFFQNPSTGWLWIVQDFY